jgi:hypothetical protein
MKKYVEIFEKFEKAFDNMPIKKKKVDQDWDGDTDFIDAKVAQYQKGGMTKGQAIAKAKQFAKKNNIKDSNKSVKEGLFNRFMKPSIDQASDDSVKGQGHSHRGNDDFATPAGEYIMFNGQKFSQDEIDYADYNDLGKIPRVEDGMLIIANPNWNN